MFRNIGVNGVMIAVAVIGAAFFGVVAIADPIALIIVLNGIFIGMMVAISVAYHRILIGSIMGKGEYNRVRQMALGIAVGWVAIAVGAFNSVYIRSMDIDIPTTPLTALTRFLAIVAAILQITAPDFGQGIFYGRDRRVLWLGGVLGALAGLVTILVQWGGLQF